MAIATCGKCGKHVFQIQEQEPAGSSVKWYYVQCTSCGTPIGVVDFYPNATVIRKIEALEKSIKGIESALSDVDYMLRQIASRMH